MWVARIPTSRLSWYSKVSSLLSTHISYGDVYKNTVRFVWGVWGVGARRQNLPYHEAAGYCFEYCDSPCMKWRNSSRCGEQILCRSCTSKDTQFCISQLHDSRSWYKICSTHSGGEKRRVISPLAAFQDNRRFCHDQGVIMFLRNYDTHLLDYTVS